MTDEQLADFVADLRDELISKADRMQVIRPTQELIDRLGDVEGRLRAVAMLGGGDVQSSN